MGLCRGVPYSQGQKLYLAKCTSCHRAYLPTERTPDEWKRIVPDMPARLTQDEQNLITEYLSAYSKAEAKQKVIDVPN
jgi:hypothetical protein